MKEMRRFLQREDGFKVTPSDLTGYKVSLPEGMNEVLFLRTPLDAMDDGENFLIRIHHDTVFVSATMDFTPYKSDDIILESELQPDGFNAEETDPAG